MIRLLFPGYPAGRAGLGLLVLRVVVGAAFMFHGWSKIQNPSGWMEGFAPGVPAVLQAAAAVSEFGGGAAVIVGFLTPLAVLGIAGTMATAIGMHHLPHGDPFVATKGGGSWELAAVYLAVMILLLLVGPGRFSLDAVLFGNRLATKSEL